MEIDFIDYKYNENELSFTIKNKEIKIEFFCFDKDFLISLCWSRKFKNLKLEDFMKLTELEKSRTMLLNKQ